MTSKALAIFASLPLLFAGSAFAGTDPEPEAEMAPTFEELDADSNGKISSVEAANYPELKTVFARVDLDQDNALTEAEFYQAVYLLRS